MTSPTPDPGGAERLRALAFAPWTLAERRDADPDLPERLRRLLLAGHRIGNSCYVAPDAVVDADRLVLGDRSYLASGVHVTGDVRLGADCSVNVGSAVRGTVTAGDDVRVGSHVAILGFNHSMDPDAGPIDTQSLTVLGIAIGSDVWIGSNAVVVDGVRIGDHAVIGAGAVVTRDVPAWAVAAGNPARVVRDRRSPRAPSSRHAGSRDPLREALTDLGSRARAQVGDILAASWRPAADADEGVPAGRDDRGARTGAPAGWFASGPEAQTRIDTRAQCDAVELAALLMGGAPPQMTRDALVDRLRGLQRPTDGLVAEVAAPATRDADGAPDGLADERLSYTTLAAAHALALLGSRLPAPVTADPLGGGASRLVAWLAELPWDRDAWRAGHLVDGVGTALLLAPDPAGDPAEADALVGWLVAHADPRTGMWGDADSGQGLRQVVNGFYRATRSTFAARRVPVALPERVIDTLLAHAQEPRWFADGRLDACNVLDVAHPLWLAGLQSGHRRDEARDLARSLLTRIVAHWRDGRGFPFALTASCPASLQGTEMWLATVWYLGALGDGGRADGPLVQALGYTPAGVHRP